MGRKKFVVETTPIPEHEKEISFDDPDDFVDDITDEELLGDIVKDRPKEVDGVDTIIVVDGVPKVGPDRFDKLRAVINKLFEKFGTIIHEEYPKDETGQTKGYIFLEYITAPNSLEALKALNNHKLDKQHTLLVNLFSDFKKYEETPNQWEPPKPADYKGFGDLYEYLMDPDGFDQFCVVSGIGQTVQIWQNSLPDSTLIEERSNWTHTYVKWSPLGTFFATFHKQGIALWGGPQFSQFMKFAHSDVQFIDFSPKEKYLVTYSPQGGEENKKLIIWDIRTGQEKRSFNVEGSTVWPIFRWSNDDKYFARMGTGILSVYETPSFGLLDKKSFKLPDLRDFEWSPSDNILAFWVAEDKNVPARVTLLDVATRNEVRNANMFSVAECKIYWQKSGDYLCVKVVRYAKARREKNELKYTGTFYNLEIFHMREKQIPVDSVKCKEIIHTVAWEPSGSKFAMIHGESPNICVSYYEVTPGQPLALLKKLERRACNHLIWSPSGRFIVLAGLGNLGGALEFVDTNDFTILTSTDHFQMSDIEWDPTGRYVTTSVSCWKNKTDTGYWIWNFQGKILKRVNLDNFSQLIWRPRPSTLLPTEQQKDIKKSLKKYYPQFENKDRMRLSKASKELIEKRAVLMKNFEEYRQKRVKQYYDQKKLRLQMRNYQDTDELTSDLGNMEEDIVEFFLKEEVFFVEDE